MFITITFYVQKSIRKPNGSVTTVTIEKLGNLDEIRSKSGGEDPYVWAQNYVNELNRKEYEKQKSVILSYFPTKLIKKGQTKSFNCGYLFLQSVYYSIGLDKLCKEIASRHSFQYDLNDILSRSLYIRILYPSSKLSSNSQKVIEQRKDILYYDCANYYFELEEADDLRRYGKSKQHQPLPLVGMGLFMDHDGIPLTFDIYPGNRNEQPPLKPLEKSSSAIMGLTSSLSVRTQGFHPRPTASSMTSP